MLHYRVVEHTTPKHLMADSQGKVSTLIKALGRAITERFFALREVEIIVDEHGGYSSYHYRPVSQKH